MKWTEEEKRKFEERRLMGFTQRPPKHREYKGQALDRGISMQAIRPKAKHKRNEIGEGNLNKAKIAGRIEKRNEDVPEYIRERRVANPNLPAGSVGGLIQAAIKQAEKEAESKSEEKPWWEV